jgi:arylsulfatase A-like enzyme
MSKSEETFPMIMQNNGYQTAIIGKWHLGFKKDHRPAGFDYWNILVDQGFYNNPIMIEMDKWRRFKGYATDLITDFSLDWLKNRDKDKPFMLLCHHKAPHRPWVPDEKHAHMYENEDIPYPETYDDDYSNRASAAEHAKMRIDSDLWKMDVKLTGEVNPLGIKKLIPPKDIKKYKIKKDGKTITFTSQEELKNWKYQTYIKDYLRCIASVDDSIGRLLDYLQEEQILDDTIVIYTSDQGFFLGDHGWFDKRFIYEESLRMPFLMRYPKEIKPGTIIEDIITNIDFAQTLLDFAGIESPQNMQGYNFRPILNGNIPQDWQDHVYYRYWENGTYHHVRAHYGIRTKRYKLIYYYSDPLGQKGAKSCEAEPEWELFDLEQDPYEINNVYNGPEYQQIIEKLKNKMYKTQARVKDKPYHQEELYVLHEEKKK